MARSLIRKTQLHPDISDLVSGYGSLFFPSLSQYYLLSGSVSTLSGNINIFSGNLNNLSGNINILSGQVQIFTTIVNQFSGNFNNIIYSTGNQSISGTKNFLTRPTFSGLNLITTGDLVNLELSILGLENLITTGDLVNLELSISGLENLALENENLVNITGDQEIFGNKKFENISNLQNAPFLASGEGKHIEKYFNVNLNSGNIIYNSPKYRNSFIFLNISNTGVYSVYLPSVTGSYETDYIRYIVDRLPLNTTQTGITGQTGITSLAWNITGWPTNVDPFCPGCSGIDVPIPVAGPSGNCDECIENFLLLEDIGFINNDISNNASIDNNIRINFYTDKFTQFITGDMITDYVPTGTQVSGTGLYTNYEQSILIYSLSPQSKDKVSFIFRDGYWDLENEDIALIADSLPSHTHSIDDIIDFPTDLSTSFNGNRQITANVIGFKNLIPGGADIVSFLNNVFYPFVSGSITLNSFPLQELGTTTTVINFQGSINTGSLRLNQFTNVEAFVNNSGRIPLLIPVVQNFNTWPVNLSLSSTSNNVYIKATGVNENDNGIQIQSNTQSIVFEAPSWYGVGANGLVTGVKNMTKYLNTRGNRTFTFNSSNNHFYYAYPNDWGFLTSIVDQNGFNITNSFSNTTGNLLLANNTTNYVYRIYQSVNPSSNTSFNITFNF